jgi:hypothetical protein
VTWIRWECNTPDHAVIGQLAEALSIREAEALGLFNGVCCRLGQHRPEGTVDLVPDISIERWSLWQGKRGRFAAAFRELCVERRDGQEDPVGTVKGWWRQRALLEKQTRDAAKRKLPSSPQTDAKKLPENPRVFSEGTPEGSEGYEDEDGNGNGNGTTPSVGRPGPPVPAESLIGQLIARMDTSPDRWAVYEFLERCPEGDRSAWARRLAGYLNGQDFPAAIKPMPAQLATACRDYSTTPPVPIHFRAFVQRVIKGPRSSSSGRPLRGRDRTEVNLSAAERFVRGEGYARS